MTEPTDLYYRSFLLRLWRPEGSSGLDWQSEIEHIQGGQRWTFDTLEELLVFLRGQADDPAMLARGQE